MNITTFQLAKSYVWLPDSSFSSFLGIKPETVKNYGAKGSGKLKRLSNRPYNPNFYGTGLASIFAFKENPISIYRFLPDFRPDEAKFHFFQSHVLTHLVSPGSSPGTNIRDFDFEVTNPILIPRFGRNIPSDPSSTEIKLYGIRDRHLNSDVMAGEIQFHSMEVNEQSPETGVFNTLPTEEARAIIRKFRSEYLECGTEDFNSLEKRLDEARESILRAKSEAEGGIKDLLEEDRLDEVSNVIDTLKELNEISKAIEGL
jgi:hypothetical protein